MKEKPILFSAPMVRAILAGRKTQTRRLFKVTSPDRTRHIITSPKEEIIRFDDGTFHYLSTYGLSGPYPCPYGQPGDRLLVKETYYAFGHWETRFNAKKQRDEWHFVDQTRLAGYAYRFAADEVINPPLFRQAGVLPSWWKRPAIFPSWWKRPAIFMPCHASRIRPEVTSVRVERLQDITEQQALEEGVKQCDGGAWDYLANDWAQGYSPRSSFGSLWQSLNGAGSWAANPWVWVIEFERAEAE
jgi:hypothetical protein